MSNLTLRERTPGEIVPLPHDRRVLEPLERLVGRSRAERLLRTVGAGGLRRMPTEELASVAGVSLDVAERVVAARDLADVFRGLDDPALGSPERVLAHLPPGFRTAETERLLAFALDGMFVAKGAILIAQGGASYLSVMALDVLRPLVRLGATSFVLAHNHPSADPTPSMEDVAFTNRVTRAAKILGMVLVDHLVVTRDAHLSFFDAGLLLDEESDEHDERPF